MDLTKLPYWKDQNLTLAEMQGAMKKILFQDQKRVPSILANSFWKNSK
jgi:hypothetical protein